MKQLVLLFLIAATTLSVSAQKDYRDNDRSNGKYDRGDRYEDKYEQNDRRDDRYPRYDKISNRQKKELKRQSAIINRDFDSRVNSVRRNPFIRGRVKSRKIEELEYERRVALNESRARIMRQRDYAGEDRNYRR
jgi:hypothetical protein